MDTTLTLYFEQLVRAKIEALASLVRTLAGNPIDKLAHHAAVAILRTPLPRPIPARTTPPKRHHSASTEPIPATDRGDAFPSCRERSAQLVARPAPQEAQLPPITISPVPTLEPDYPADALPQAPHRRAQLSEATLPVPSTPFLPLLDHEPLAQRLRHIAGSAQSLYNRRAGTRPPPVFTG